MHGFPHKDYFPRGKELAKAAVFITGLGTPSERTFGSVTVQTACNETGATILLVRPEALRERKFPLTFIPGRPAAFFDGSVYGFHHLDQATGTIILHQVVANQQEGEPVDVDHDRFENEGGVVVHKNADAGVNWPNGGDRPQVGVSTL